MLIGLAGYAQSGKTSTANILKARFGFTDLALADPVRQLAEAIDPIIIYRASESRFMRYSELLAAEGYEEAKKYPEFRRTLQRIGTEAGRQVFGEDVWVGLLFNRIATVQADWRKSNVVVTDVRFPNEAAAIRTWGGRVWRINRRGQTSTDPHPSEAHIATLDVNRDITASDLAELEREVVAAYMEAQ